MSTFVIRPGETDFDVQDRVQGALDLPLNDRGHVQVDEIISALRGQNLDVIYASPTEPALSTARRMATELDLPLKVLDGLANLDLGLWEGLCRSEIRQKQPRVFRQWEESPQSVCPPHGEPCEEAIARVKRAVRKPLHRGGAYAVVASEPIAMLVACVLRGGEPCLGWPHAEEHEPGQIECLDAKLPAIAAVSQSWTRH